MDQETEYYIACPLCFPNNIYGTELTNNTHIVRTFVYGAPGFDTEKIDYGWTLDGRTSDTQPYHDIVGRSTQRGSIIDILMVGEQCNHYFMKRTYFHKGDVRESIFPVDTEKINRLLITWMDRD